MKKAIVLPSAEASESKLLKTLAGQAQSPPPLWLMRQAGRYLPEYRELRTKAGSFLDLCYTPKLAAEVTLQPVRRFGFDAAIIFSDILVVPHALGQKVSFTEGEGPKLEPITNRNSLAPLKPNSARDWFSRVCEAIDRAAGKLPAGIPLIGFCGAPWTVATYMIEGRGSDDKRAAKLMAWRDPVLFAAIIDMLVETSAIYLAEQIAAGARVIQIFDSWAGCLSDGDFDAHVIAPTAKLVARVKADHPNVPVIGFPRGSASLYLRYAERTGIDGIGCDTAAPLALMSGLQSRYAVQGNLDPLLLLAGGDAMDRRVETILAALAGKPFVFNLGHGILPETPIKHVERLVHLVRVTAR